MKQRFCKIFLAVFMIAFAGLAGAPRAVAQDSGGTITNSSMTPVVTIMAADSVAGEGGRDTGSFLIRRHGSTNMSVLVFFQVGGTATPGDDYEPLPSNVLIPAGAITASLVVRPVDDNIPEPNETVVVELIPSLLMGPMEYYRIGSPSNAVVNIVDNDRITPTNTPPMVRINQPADGAVFPAPADIPLAAYAQDHEDGYDVKVEFFEGRNSLGMGSFVPTLCPSPYCPFFALTWSNVPPGTYTLTAKATDKNGATSVSAPVHVVVQPPLTQPVINIVATDPHAEEIPEVPPGMEMPQRIDPAVFTVTRTGPTNEPLDVFYILGGTASRGVDYANLPGMVTIPAGLYSAPIEVEVIDDLNVEGPETVVITLEPPVCIAIYPPPPSCYLVGPTNRAVAIIQDNDREPTNHPPAVRIVRPENGQVFPASADVRIVADTVDADGYVGRVEFYEGARLIGEDIKLFLVPPPPGQVISYELVWSNVPPGRYVLTAKAFDDQGAFTVSAPVAIAVIETNQPPGTNLPPLVSIVATDSFASEGLVVWCSNTVVGASLWGTNLCWRTNQWGTNTATFKVRRHGSTNDDLSVRYAISGTASNGVDYESLPGVAVIPAGQRTAEIAVVPIDDNLAERIETVVLALVPPSSLPVSSPPPYLLGQPSRAAAIIVDNDLPRPPCLRLSDHLFNVCRLGTNGTWHRIEVSTNLVNWTAICTNMVSDGAIQFVDPDAQDDPVRFYRAVHEASPAGD